MAQSDTYCGLSYYYDAAGNRNQRSIAGCGEGGGGDERLMVIKDSIPGDSTSQALTEKLFPNPTNGPVSVVFNSPVSEAKVIITDNLGRELYNATVSGSTIPLNISNFAEGIYLIVVRTGGNSYQSTVVKE